MTQADFGDNDQCDVFGGDGFEYNDPGSKRDRALPSHELRMAAVTMGLKAHLASTLADVAYWLQSARYKRSDLPAIWLTGRQASARLGGHPRTINRNLRSLEKLGYIRIENGPSAGGPYLRVTWVIPTELIAKLYATAHANIKERDAQRKKRQSASERYAASGLTEWNG